MLNFKGLLILLLLLQSNQLRSALLDVDTKDPLLAVSNQLTKDDFIFLNYLVSDIKSHRLLKTSDNVPHNVNQHYHFYQPNISLSLRPFLTMNGDFTEEICQEIPVFVQRQKRMCKNYLELIPSVIKGYAMAINECETQFLEKRWNCRGHNHTIQINVPSYNRMRRIYRTYMDRLIAQSNKESGFVLAITSAGVAHTVTKMCATGRLSKCGCENVDTVPINPAVSQGHEWRGCSENVHFGETFAKNFLDPKLIQRIKRFPESTLTNLHNNLVGRKAVVNRMTKKCACHGPSGSCQMQACFRTLPDFRVVGSSLAEMYTESKKIEVINNKLFVANDEAPLNNYNYFFKRNVRTTPQWTMKPFKENPTDSQLVYLNPSPSYCNHDNKAGILGTVGRVCQLEREGPSHCNEMCCGRGFVEETHQIERKCNCKFKWCCKVECQICDETVKIYRCR